MSWFETSSARGCLAAQNRIGRQEGDSFSDASQAPTVTESSSTSAGSGKDCRQATTTGQMAKGENGAWDLNALYDVEWSEKNCDVKVIERRGWEKVGESPSCAIGCKHQQTTRGEVGREGWRHVEMISKLRCSGTVERAPFAGRRW